MWEAWREEARVEARKSFPYLMKNPLFIAGIMLYWGEGDSNLKNGHVGFTNTNHHMMRIYSAFLSKVCLVKPEAIKAQMILYPDLDEGRCLSFWSEVINVPATQFYKTQYIQGRHPTKRLSHGICMIRFADRRLKEKIAIWIDLFQQNYSAENLRS
jgi:hypothetical protein